MSVWRFGSMVGMPPWCRSKCRPDGVMMPWAVLERGHGPGRFLGRGREAPTHLGLELRAGAVAAVVTGEPALHLGRILGHVVLDRAGRCFGADTAREKRHRGRARERGRTPEQRAAARVREHALLAVAVLEPALLGKHTPLCLD
jgi:hypothetical protein